MGRDATTAGDVGDAAAALAAVALAAVALLIAGCDTADDRTGDDPAAGDRRDDAASARADREAPDPRRERAAPAAAACPRPASDALGRLDTLATEGGDDEPVRLILVVGDGVGAGYWTAARLARPDLAVFGLPVVGFTDTRNARGRVTDSAASATALATGCLTYNRSIGMGPDTTALATVLEVARRRGLATGLVTTARVTHATPAAFAAHAVDRDHEDRIAVQMADFGLDVLLGGGRERFRAEDRRDGQDLLGRLRKGRPYVETPAGLDSILAADGPSGSAPGTDGASDTTSPAAPAAAPEAGDGRPAGLIGLFADADLPPAPERQVSLVAMTRAALQTLDRDSDGFFLVVEAAQPDWRGHHGASLDAVRAEMLDLDDVVRAAREYRGDRPETLLVIASDHETGGLAVVQEGHGLAARWARTGYVSVRDHTANLVVHFAAGPGADALRGIQTLASIGRRLMTAVAGEELLPTAER